MKVFTTTNEATFTITVQYSKINRVKAAKGLDENDKPEEMGHSIGI